MAHIRRLLSIVSPLALGLGALALVLLAGGQPAAAAPAGGGDGKPAPASQCFARDDSATGTIYSSATSNAIRQAVAAAVPHDLVRLAGTCAGVAAQGGTTQTVVITQPLTLIGGYSLADWNNTYPITQPTVLDALGQGRVITASGDITIANLTAQNGHSFGGNGGGIYAGANLTVMGTVSILSSTTLVSATVLRPSDNLDDICLAEQGDGGGVFVRLSLNTSSVPSIGIIQLLDLFNDSAGGSGGGLRVGGQAALDDVAFVDDLACADGGGADFAGTVHLTDSQFSYNISTNGAGLYTESGATLLRIVAAYNIAAYGGGFWAAISGNQVNATGLTASHNQAVFGAVADFYQVLAIVTASQFNDNTASTGGALYFVDANGRVSNSTFMRNTAAEGRVIAASRLLRAEQLLLEINYLSAFGPGSLSGASALPLAVSTPLTGSAFSTSGIGLLISDTILSGFALDLETGTAPSSTISGDYNLFDHTPVLSGTAIVTGAHSLVGNPLFADAAGHLSAGSPAINHGIDVGNNTDLDGNPRPSGGGFDIGAYEFQVALAKLFLPLVRR